MYKGVGVLLCGVMTACHRTVCWLSDHLLVMLTALSRLHACPFARSISQATVCTQVDVYTTWAKVTNCNGGGQCGTCIVDVRVPLAVFLPLDEGYHV